MARSKTRRYDILESRSRTGAQAPCIGGVSHQDSESHAIRTRANSARIADTDHGKMRGQGFDSLKMSSDALSFNSLTW